MGRSRTKDMNEIVCRRFGRVPTDEKPEGERKQSRLKPAEEETVEEVV